MKPGTEGQSCAMDDSRRRLTKVNHKLDDLQCCDVLLPPDLDPASVLKVVPVHDNVNHQVQCNRYPRNWRVSDQLRVAEKCRCAMMVSMEEC